MTAKPPRRQRLLAALDYIGREKRARTEPAIVIRRLVEEHGGRFDAGAQTNALSVAGTRATCTWDKGQHLLECWTTLAHRHLLVLDGRADAARERVA
jgi:hypothetical protein